MNISIHPDVRGFSLFAFPCNPSVSIFLLSCFFYLLIIIDRDNFRYNKRNFSNNSHISENHVPQVFVENNQLKIFSKPCNNR